MLPQSLAGVRVVEWCEGIPGPYCGRLLTELGADVVKVEAPGTGDAARRRPPFKAPRGRSSRSGGLSAMFLYCNAGKRGVTLRPETTEGRRIMEALLAAADVLIEDRPPGLMHELGLGYKALRARDPRLVIASITPFGQDGPYARYKAYALNLFHAGGEGYIQPGGPGYGAHPERPPLMAGGDFSEAACGSTAAAGVIAALFRRGRTGRGDHIDLSCQEALMTLGRAELAAYPNAGFIEERRNRWINLGGLMPTADGYVEMVLTEPRMWEGLVRAMGNPAWAGDPAYATPDERSRRKFEINPRIEAWTRSLPGREVREALQANQCPAFEVRTVEELAGARQYQERGFWVDEKDGALGRARTPSTPFGGPKPHLGPAPRLGQHNAQVYRELELRAGDLRRLEAEGVI